MNAVRTDLAALRVRKDVNELSKAKFTCNHARTRIEFPDGVDNMLQLIFYISIADHSGPYANGDFTFHVEIPRSYPFQPPTVTCRTRIWHPNVDATTGRVMISILGNDWRPVLTINAVLLGLQLIFLEPGIDAIMNPLAAEQLQSDPVLFRHHVQQMLLGGNFFGLDFSPHKRVIEKRRQEGVRAKLKRSHDDHESDHAQLSVDVPSVYPLEKHPAHMWKRKRLN